jgi:hypothetical protein
MTDEFRIVEATLEHAALLALSMRSEEQAEVFASLGFTPEEALTHAIGASEEAYAAFLGDTILCIFGITPYALVTQTASPWMLTSDAMPKHPRLLLKYTKLAIERWLERYPILINYIDARYEPSLRWARWAGFTVSAPQPYGLFDMPFCRIEMRKT